MNDQIKWLKIAYLAGIITDALALVPMLYPPIAELMWGFDKFNGEYIFAMGFGASLMLGWTLLLIWAYREPLERRFIAFLTILVIIGFIATEIFAVANGYIDLDKMVPTFVIQAVLMGLFGFGYVDTCKTAKGKKC
jgi:hypothetical protein